MNSEPNCPFCSLDESRIRHEISTFLIIRDGYPVSPGHTLIIPKAHLVSLFDLGTEEFADLQTAIHWAKADIEQEFSPDGYNLGVNDGPDAGQTVPHLHLHLIPRYQGDQPDPRGGVRWVIPEKAKYWRDED
jgi:diadenosine tetraphosphate (Ap4A) HIT family hydrolase